MTPELLDEAVVDLAIVAGYLLVLDVGCLIAGFMFPQVPFIERFLDNLPNRESEDYGERKEGRPMANMSYCRFHNTRLDMEDCLDALRDDKLLSKDEAKAGRWMFEAFLDFCRDHFIITDYDASEIEVLFERHTEKEEEDEDDE